MICLVAGLVAGVLFNIYLSDNVLYGYLPVAGGVAYGVFVILAFVLTLDALHSELLMKIGIIFNALCWSAYGVFIKLYPVMIFNGVAFVLAVVSIIRIAIAKRKKKSIPPDTPAPSDPPAPLVSD